MRPMRLVVATYVLAAVANMQGCQLFPHWMQPSQLWKLNRQPAYDETPFSVPDPGHAPITVAPPPIGSVDHESTWRTRSADHVESPPGS